MKKMSNKYRHLVWPLASLALLLLYNAFFTEDFFKVYVKKGNASEQTQVVGKKDNTPAAQQPVAQPTEQQPPAEQQPVAQTAEQSQPEEKDGGFSIFDYHFSGTPVLILKQGSEVMLLAIGMTLVIATGGIDISVGAVMAIAGAVAALLMDMFEHQLPASAMETGLYWLIPVFAALLLATLCGFWNGMLVAGCGIQPMVATLVLMVSGRGMAQLITSIGRSKPEQITFQSEQLAFLRNGYVLMVPCCLWIVVIMYIIAGLLTRKTALGLFIESVGNNEHASRYAGIESRRIKWLAYIICGFCAGMAGLLTLCDTKSIDANNAGLYLELDAILATVIGGTSMAGGRFFLSGSLIGAILIQTLTATMIANKVDSSIIPLPKALVVIIVCLLQSPVFRAKVFSLFASKSAKGGVQ